MIITKNELINQLSKRVTEERMVVQNIYDELERLYYEYFKSASPSDTVEVRPFEGFVFKCEYEDKKEKFHPGKQEIITQSPRIWVKPHITRNYNRKLNIKT